MDDLLSRTNDAIGFLKEGLHFRVGELYLGCSSANILDVTADSRSVAFENMTKQSALSELNEIKKIFYHLTNVSDDFRVFVCTKEIQFNLFLSAGQSDMRICSEKNGTIIWHYPLRY